MTYSLGTSPNAVCLLRARNLSLPYHGLIFDGSKDILLVLYGGKLFINLVLRTQLSVCLIGLFLLFCQHVASFADALLAGKTLLNHNLNQVTEQRFSLKQWFPVGARSYRLRKTGSVHCY